MCEVIENMDEEIDLKDNKIIFLSQKIGFSNEETIKKLNKNKSDWVFQTNN